MYVRRSKCVLIQHYIHNTYSNMIFSKNENTILLVYFSRLSGKRRNNDRNYFSLFENCSSSFYGFWEAIHLRKQLAFSKNHFIIWDTTLTTQRELLCVWNTFNHDPTRFFFHPLRNVITHSLDLSSREREKNTHTTTYYKCHQLAAFQCWYPFPYGYLSFTPSEPPSFPFNLPWRGFKHWRRRTTDV